MLVAGRACCWSPAGGPRSSAGSRSGSSATSRRASDGRPPPAARRRAPLRRAHRPRAAALGLAAADLDAHRAGAAAPARAGRHPRLGHPAGGRRRAQDLAVAGRPPAAHTDLRAARAVRRLPVAVVRGDLPAADGLAGRLLRPAHRASTGGRSAPSRPRPRVTSTGCPTTRRTARSCRPTTSSTALGPRSPATASARTGGRSSAERGYLREAGNLLFHVSVLVVLVGFGVGTLFGFRGGVIVVVGNGMSSSLTQYDEFQPGSLFGAEDLDEFYLDIDDFDVEWLEDGPSQGQARKFVSHVTYAEAGEEPQEYDLRVNHPLSIGDTDVFLIGHGYAPVITVRDGNGDVAYSGPTIFLPEDQTFQSIGVVKAPDARPEQIGLEGWFYPTYVVHRRRPGRSRSSARRPTRPSRCRCTPATSAWAPASRSRSTPSTRAALELVTKEDGVDVPRRPGAGGQGRAARTVSAASSSSGWSGGTRSSSARLPASGSRSAGSCWRCSDCSGRCSSGRGGPGCARLARGRAHWSRSPVLDRAGGDDVSVVLADLVAALQGREPTRRRRDRRSMGGTVQPGRRRGGGRLLPRDAGPPGRGVRRAPGRRAGCDHGGRRLGRGRHRGRPGRRRTP